MLEIRFHGRGGQGTVLAAKIISEAVLRGGTGQCLAIPEFGVERRGAPVVAYARISDQGIKIRSKIYAPGAVVLLDPRLTGSGITQGLSPGALIIINSERDLKSLSQQFPGMRVRSVPARRIALKHGLGPKATPLVNTTMAGAVCAMLDLADRAAVADAVASSVPVKTRENAEAALEAFDLVEEKLYA
ncbi:MAG: 2-oxoacid:acceptor oxidoreductase family protein [Elusimicrobia bacterium]|nr:2-oxoacid:acceptor oxidoreductase family protein [Elusimicrobiota bacterium]